MAQDEIGSIWRRCVEIIVALERPRGLLPHQVAMRIISANEMLAVEVWIRDVRDCDYPPSTAPTIKAALESVYVDLLRQVASRRRVLDEELRALSALEVE